ncbi:MAG: DUF169 domain-containing protein [Thermoleophilia bacterium]|nr:DUF169 domain-containing protein [Thermoleophilia bacterium]
MEQPVFASKIPDPSPILDRLAITQPLVAFYDAPDPAPFAPLVEPRGRECIFASFKDWREGRTLHLTKQKHGCGGGHLLGVQPRSREEMVAFLCDQEGLRATRDLMNQWLDVAPRYIPIHEHILIGPFRPEQYEYLRTITFFVNPDQLAVLFSGAVYYAAPADPEPVISRFGSGCMQLTSVFNSLDIPQASIGSLDHAMRRYLEPWMIAFTVTRPMFEQLCRWSQDPKSSLHTEFTNSLIKARGGSLATR